jgi:hypothetical protein
MIRRAGWALTFTLALTVLQTSAFAQAAGETVLLNSGSAAATAKAGKSFKAGSDRIGKQLAGRLERQTSPPVRKTTTVTTHAASPSEVQGKASDESTTSAHGPMIASIQGAQTSCTPTPQTDAKPESQTAAAPAQTDCNGQGPRKPASQERPSVITLSFSK